MHAEVDTPEEERERVKLCLRGLREDVQVWPQWSHQSCYFAFNLTDWAALAQDLEVVEACKENIERFDPPRTCTRGTNASTASSTCA